MPRQISPDAHEWINEIPTVPIYYLAKSSAKGTGLANTAGLSTRGTADSDNWFLRLSDRAVPRSYHLLDMAERL